MKIENKEKMKKINETVTDVPNVDDKFLSKDYKRSRAVYMAQCIGKQKVMKQ